MKSFYEKEDYTIEDIESLIANQVEESIYLDFKEAGAFEKSERKRNDISKDVASFANSDGGIIVYGVKEVDHKAAELSFIDGNEFTKEWLEQVINSSIQRHIEDLKIYPIRANGEVSKTIYVVKIPVSFQAPHLSKDNRYYKRYNFASVPMEEYEVRESYNRKEKTELIIEDMLVTQNGRSGVQGGEFLRTVQFDLTFQITNLSKGIENQYKTEIYIPKAYLVNISFNRYFIRDEGRNGVYSFANTSPIFQGEITTICNTTIEITHQTLVYIDFPILVKLYFTNGVKEKEFLLDSLSFKGKLLKDWSWM
jgi:hypothetical protein